MAALEGLPVDVDCMAEGSLFLCHEPVLRIAGDYARFAEMETALLGLLCQASGIATRAARCRPAAGGRTLVSFGARRAHPALAPMIDRACYLGGCDGVLVVASARLLDLEPTGTMPHALIMVAGDLTTALQWFDEIIDPDVARVALVDTFCDEKFEALTAAQTLGERLAAVRLDTPGSRRGDMLAIMREVRWELDLRGYEHVQLFLSGGLDEYDIEHLNELADGYGVGTALSSAPPVDLAMDIVVIEGEPLTKRGKLSGVKEVAVCPTCATRTVIPAGRSVADTCGCGERSLMALQPLLRAGELVADLPAIEQIRTRREQQVRAWVGAHPETVDFVLPT